jgi:hypothetical protein
MMSQAVAVPVSRAELQKRDYAMNKRCVATANNANRTQGKDVMVLGWVKAQAHTPRLRLANQEHGSKSVEGLLRNNMLFMPSIRCANPGIISAESGCDSDVVPATRKLLLAAPSVSPVHVGLRCAPCHYHPLQLHVCAQLIQTVRLLLQIPSSIVRSPGLCVSRISVQRSESWTTSNHHSDTRLQHRPKHQPCWLGLRVATVCLRSYLHHPNRGEKDTDETSAEQNSDSKFLHLRHLQVPCELHRQEEDYTITRSVNIRQSTRGTLTQEVRDNVDSEGIVQASHLRSDVGFGTTLAVCEETMQISTGQESRDDTAYPGLDTIRSVQSWIYGTVVICTYEHAEDDYAPPDAHVHVRKPSHQLAIQDQQRKFRAPQARPEQQRIDEETIVQHQDIVLHRGPRLSFARHDFVELEKSWRHVQVQGAHCHVEEKRCVEEAVRHLHSFSPSDLYAHSHENKQGGDGDHGIASPLECVEGDVGMSRRHEEIHLLAEEEVDEYEPME